MPRYSIGESLPGHGTVVKVSKPIGRTVITVGRLQVDKPFRVVSHLSDYVKASFSTIEEALKYFHDEVPGGCDLCMVDGDIHS